jgi:histidinol-phosphatase (PHP family)
MLFDSHVHSSASPDSEMPPQDAIAAAKSRGLGITFTEHADFADHIEKDPDATDFLRGLGDFVCDFEKYPKEYKKYRGEGVILGLECGLTQAFLPENKKRAANDYDFIIGSIHSVDGAELYNAANGRLPDEEFARRLTSGDENSVFECVRRYLIYAREMAEISNYFDSFGHIDYISRYVPLAEKFFSYENFPVEFDALLKIISEKNLVLEINTNTFGGKNAHAEKIMQKICTRFHELGGRFCTIGSDAHKVKNVGKCISAAKEIAQSSNLIPVYFKERKAIRCE